MKVAILGSASGGLDAPFEDPSVEKWGLNDLYTQLSPSQLRTITRWFELHGDTPLTRRRRRADHWDNLQALGIPIYTFHDLPGVDQARMFDLEDVITRSGGRSYFACTMAYEIALALAEGATAISLYGIVLSTAREALVERPCVEWWLGFAEGKGVTVTVHHGYSHGLSRQPYRYALDDYEERSHTFEFVKHHHTCGLDWILAEDQRLSRQSCVNS